MSQNDDIYKGKDSDPVVVNDLVELFNDNFTEHAAIKQVVDVAANQAGFDFLVDKIKNKPKILSTEFANALKKDLSRKLSYPVKEKKFSEGLSKINKIASYKIAAFLAKAHPVTKKAFLKDMGHPGLVETVISS
jgi:hypothetical protein